MEQRQNPASTGACPFCGATLRSDQKVCPSCGAQNPHYVVDSPRRITHPKTIEELKEYCAERGMPLLRMRFFIGEDYRQPRAFGIYRDGDRFVVYKNKDNGNRAVRYDGPDEAYAVNEIFQKLLSECHNRGIYPDGKPAQAYVGTAVLQADTGPKPLWKRLLKGVGIFLVWPFALLVYLTTLRDPRKKPGCIFPLLLVAGIGVSMILIMIHLSLLIVLPVEGIGYVRDHKGDGYYRYADETVYYKDGTNLYYGNVEDSWWTPTYSSLPLGREQAFLGKDYSEAWGIEPFEESRAGYPAGGYYRLGEGTWYYCYGTTWFVYDTDTEAWMEHGAMPRNPVGFAQDGAYLGVDHDPAWEVPDVDRTFSIAVLKNSHSRDGYYRFGDAIYYYYGYSYDLAQNWYAYGEDSGWHSVDAPGGDWDEAFLSAENDPAWGLPDAADAFVIVTKGDSHGRDGYYRFGDDVYYYYGKYYDPDDNWYSYSDGDWVRTDAPTGSYDSTYEGEDWDADWGSESFTDSSMWDDLHPSYSSSSSDSYSSYDSGSSYDSWDSGGTDWSSDW